MSPIHTLIYKQMKYLIIGKYVMLFVCKHYYNKILNKWVELTDSPLVRVCEDRVSIASLSRSCGLLKGSEAEGYIPIPGEGKTVLTFGCLTET